MNDRERIRFLRQMIGISRETIEKKYDLSSSTLFSWENGRLPLTDKGIKRCLEIFRKEGISVTEEWIRHGTGYEPIFTKESSSFLVMPTTKSLPANSKIDTLKEIEIIKTLYSDIIIYFIDTQEMSPKFNVGDYVAGKVCHNEIYELHNMNCIVHLETGEYIFRRIIVNNDNSYTLICDNPLSSPNPVIYNPPIKKIAPVMFHRISNIDKNLKY
ncbi:MAG: hypothetical protein J0H68_09685 [Sphingobacteriia bacterium]|nr:hypothetical protein [Sphingobacteriia bacterium]